MTVGSVLHAKCNNIWSVTPEITVFDAIKIMVEKNISALLVMQKENVVGIFSERDYARKAVLRRESPRKIAVKDVMTSEILPVTQIYLLKMHGSYD